MNQQYISKSENDTCNIAKKIADKIKQGSVITFSGDLGAGKTFLCRQIIRNLCNQDLVVTSPTFNLLQIYQAPGFEIYHFDLYRLKTLEEIYELGIEEALSDHVCLIEWPEIISSILPQGTISVELSIIDNSTRIINYQSL